jgi:uncharacterized protein (DUF433 family)
MALDLTPIPVPLRVDETGTIRVGQTRVTLELVVSRFDQGESPEEIISGFPSLQLADVYAVVTYCLQHRPEVEAYLQEQERRAARVRKLIEARFDQRGLREKLLACRATQQNV